MVVSDRITVTLRTASCARTWRLDPLNPYDVKIRATILHELGTVGVPRAQGGHPEDDGDEDTVSVRPAHGG